LAAVSQIFHKKSSPYLCFLRLFGVRTVSVVDVLGWRFAVSDVMNWPVIEDLLILRISRFLGILISSIPL
jgi:hypothetical protein